MIRFFVRRLAAGILLVLALTFVTYSVFFLIPVNPACLALDCGPGNHTTQMEFRQTEHRLGLDQPVVVQYGRFLWRLVSHGSLGDSYRGHFSVTSTLASTLPATASLVLGGALLLILLALPLGAVSALRPHGLLDRSALAVSIFGISLHPFVLALLLRSAFADHLSVAPRGGYCPLFGHASFSAAAGGPIPGASIVGSCGGFADWAYHLYLPWFVFALFFLPMYTRMFRAHILQTLGERYVQTAHAKGASLLHVFRAHVLRNSILPILPMLAMDVGTAITTAIYVETIFKIGGLGTLAVNALSGDAGGYDLPTIVGIVFVVAVAVVVLNLIVDLALVVLDPRITGRAGRRSVWRRDDGGLNRRRTVLAAAAVAAGVAGSAYAASRQSTPPPARAAAVAKFTHGGHAVAAHWKEWLTPATSWTRAEMTERGSIVIEIHRIVIGPHGWSVTATIANKTNQPLTLRTGLPLVHGYADSGSAGFSIQYRDRNSQTIFGYITALPALAYKPDPPTELPQKASWTGTFAGDGNLPQNVDLHIGAGVFHGPHDHYGFTLVTSRSFTRK